MHNTFINLVILISILETLSAFENVTSCENDEFSCKVDLKDQWSNTSFSEFLRILKEYYDDIPDCRKDQCQAIATVIQNKRIFWPNILLGERFVQKCRYHYIRDKVTYFPGHKRPVLSGYYMYRDCMLLNENGMMYWTSWSLPNYQICPHPPFKEQVSIIYESRKFSKDSSTCTTSLEQLESLYNLKDDNIDDEGFVITDQFDAEYAFFAHLLFEEGLHCLIKKFFTEKKYDHKKLFTYLDAVTDSKFESFWKNNTRYITNIIEIQGLIFMFPNYETIANNDSQMSLPYFNNNLSDIDNSNNINYDEKAVSVTEYKPQLLRTTNENYKIYLSGTNIVFSLDTTKDEHFSRHYKHGRGNSVELNLSWNNLNYNRVTQITSTLMFHKMLYSVQYRNQVYVASMEITSPLLHIDVKSFENETADKFAKEVSNLKIQVKFQLTETNKSFFCGCLPFKRRNIDSVSGEYLNKKPNLNKTICYINNYQDCFENNANEWNILNTEWIMGNKIKTNITTKIVTCNCSYVGFIGVFSRSISIEAIKETVQRSEARPTISGFYNFPHVYHLPIVSVVMRIISLICLLLTIINFIAVKKAHKGTPTRILINLCVTLICFIMVFFIAEYRSHLKVECRIFNVLRYYLAFVSLMWNGVDAHHMYSTIVKVFHSNIRHFVRKAAVVSWGFPVILIAVTLTIDAKAFEGFFEGCSFRCGLKLRTMYFAWLIPMILIVVHNIIVFILIFKCLANLAPVDDDASKKSTISRLIGAIALLILLGVPWLLNAFGTLKHHSSESETFKKVIAVIFEVFVCLQGFFIFVYHCTRNKHIRKRWKTVFSRSDVSDSSTTSTKKTFVNN